VANRFVTWCGAHKVKPEMIKLDQCLKYINYLNANAIGNNTIFNVLLVLKAVYNGLLKESKIKYNPFILVPKIKRAPVSLMYFNDAQILAMKGYCSDHNKQLWIAIQLLFSCFIRPGELRLLQIYDVNLHDGYIEIKGEISKNGKTEKVIIPDYVRSQLSFLNDYPGYFYIIGKNGYPSADPVGTNYLNNTHRAMLNELKIRGHYAYYSWKHTGVVKAVKAGINIKELQLQLRHSSLDMVNEYLKNLGVLDSDMIRHHFPTI
jgi:integrase